MTPKMLTIATQIAGNIPAGQGVGCDINCEVDLSF